MILQRPAAGFGPLDIETALLDSAAGDHAAEAGALLLTSLGTALPQLHRLGLITVDVCLDGCCGGPTAWIDWAGLDAALSGGLLAGSPSDLAALRLATSLADGRPVDLRQLAAGLDRRAVTLVQAAIAIASDPPEPLRAADRGPER